MADSGKVENDGGSSPVPEKRSLVSLTIPSDRNLGKGARSNTLSSRRLRSERPSVVSPPKVLSHRKMEELLEPYFFISVPIPGLYGAWGPFFNTELIREERNALYILLFATIAVVFFSGLVAYLYRISLPDFECEPLPFKTTVSFFLNLDANFLEFMLGMVQGIIFGFIDNGGLWAGMDALDPVFNPDKVPWVYGRGGRRYYDGLTRKGHSVYAKTKFEDGQLTEEELQAFIVIQQKVAQQYDEARENNGGMISSVNEAAFADPASLMFVGHNMTKKLFMFCFEHRLLNEKTYKFILDIYSKNARIDNVSSGHLIAEEPELDANGEPMDPEAAASRASVARTEMDAMIENFFGEEEDGQVMNYKIIRKFYEVQNSYQPGKSKHLADAMLQGWEPGKLTQAGIGNTYSDMLGGSVSVFVAQMIITGTGQCTNSLVAEVIGLVFGCLLGILISRMFSSKT